MMLHQGVCAALLLALTSVVRADLILSSPARLPKDQETAIYQPIAALLTRVTGEQIVYRHPGSYLMYRRDMHDGRYDVVFDGPAFVDWRRERLGHRLVARLDRGLAFVVMARQDNPRAPTLAALVDKPLCGYAPPHIATLTILAEYDPARLPRLMLTESFEEAYYGVATGKCEAGILPVQQLAALDRDNRLMRTVFTSRPIPNQAFTVSARLQRHAGTIAKALTDPANRKALQPLLDGFKAQAVVPVDEADYRGMRRLLKDEWGFE
jgi:hypothetical protein